MPEGEAACCFLPPEHVQIESNPTPVTDGPIRPLVEMEREHILAALQAADGKISGQGGAAELLGLNPNTLGSRMKKLGIGRDIS